MSPLIVNYRPFKPPTASASPQKKRAAPDSGSDAPPTKKQKQKIKTPYHRRHRLESPLDLQIEGAVIPDGPSVSQLLDFSLGQALREAGFEQADPVAMEGFHGCVEAHMLKLLSHIRASMISSRRAQPLPLDFEFALRQNGISVDSLRPHVKPPPPTRKTLPNLPSPLPEEPIASDIDHSFLGDSLSGPLQQQALNYIPKHFPKFPSRHTYESTEVFPKREVDPRKVREQATEEGRLGEEALRKLTRAAKEGQAQPKQRMKRRLWGRRKESMETMFDKTLKAIMKRSAEGTQNEAKAERQENVEVPLGLGLHFPPTTSEKPAPPSNPPPAAEFEMGPIINYDRVHWRKAAFVEPRRSESEAAQSARATQAVE